MAVTFKPLLPILILSSLLLYEDWVSTPSCKPVPPPDPTAQNNNPPHDDDLKVMFVSDLLLLGSDHAASSYFRVLFRHYYLSKFFEKSMRTLDPDMLVILGDISARGHELSRSQLASVVRQFHSVVGPPFLELPIHVALGDRDVGVCGELREEAVSWIARVAGVGDLDSAGNGGFEIGNVSFVSLNAVALMCGSNEVRFGVEKAVERERVDFRVGNAEGKMMKRDGPVVLLHFPLHRNVNADRFDQSSDVFDKREDVGGRGPYDLVQKLPPNATEYIFQALRPRIVFSAHTQEFNDHFHPDGTREVTVPAMTWNARVDPGFVIAMFRRNEGAVSISYCSLPRESHILIVYALLLIILVSMLALSRTPNLRYLKPMTT